MARLKIGKNRTTLVIDETKKIFKTNGREQEFYIHREVTHINNKNNEKIYPNPDEKDKKTMFLKLPRALPKRLFVENKKSYQCQKN